MPSAPRWSALSRWSAYRRAYSNSPHGRLAPFMRRGLYSKAAARLALATPPDAHVLDIGTGPGHLLIDIARQMPHATLRGVDIDPYMTDESHRTVEMAGLADRITISEAGAAALPFASAEFDCAISLMSYHLWDDRPTGLAEIRRVLKPGATLHLYVGRWEAYPGRLPVLDYLNHASQKTLEAALDEAGFENLNAGFSRRMATYLFASGTRPR